MLEELKKNLENESRIIKQMGLVLQQIKASGSEDREFYEKALASLSSQFNILNDSIPLLLDSISPVKKLTEEVKKEPTEIVKFSYVSPVTNDKQFITINKKDKDKFVQELKLSESGFANIKKLNNPSEIKPSQLARVSNIIFSNFSEKITPNFRGLNDDIKKANIRFMLPTYISMGLFCSIGAFVLGLVLYGILLVVSMSFLSWFWIPFLLMFFCFLGFYLYPALEKGSVEKEVAYELPFATIHMAAIAGSNIEPLKIFKIIANSSEYPNIGREIKKMVNQVEIYGYDLVTALKNSARQTPNKKLADLFSGLATNIVSGGDLKSYLEKKADNFLLDYKLERQRYSAIAETFMDIYISILIAAPLIMMMMFIVMNITGLGVGGLSLGQILVFAIGGVALANIIFLIVLQIKQPKS